MKLTVNGQDHVLEGVDPTMPLLWTIRDLLGLKGTKFGCGQALCGACTVHLDGQPVRSCQTSLADVGDSKITTIEAIAGRVAEAVKSANTIGKRYRMTAQYAACNAGIVGPRSPTNIARPRGYDGQ